MGWIKDTFFGGSAEDAAQSQVQSYEKAMEYQREAGEQARSDVLNLFGPGYGEMMSGYQSAQDQIASGFADTSQIYKQASQQADASMRQGNQASINALLGRNAFQNQTMPAMRDFSSLQPQGQTTQKVESQQSGLSSPVQSDQSGVMPSIGRPRVSTGPVIRDPSFYNLQAQRSARPMAMTARSPSFQRRAINEPGRPVMPGTAIPGYGVNNSMGGGDQLPEATTQQTDINPVDLNAPTMNPQQNIQQPDVSGIGLSGAESALKGGLQGQLGSYGQGLSSGLNTIGRALQGELGAYQQGIDSGLSSLRQGLQGQLGAYDQSLSGAEDAVTGAAQDQTQAIQQGVNQQSGAVTEGYQSGIGEMQPYADTGQQALQKEAALSGALGAEAQQQAIDSFMESPGQKYLREQAEKALLRNASATGGLRGGSTLAALQEQAIGLSAQQQQRQLENMRSLAGRGQQASGNIAGMQVGQGQDLSNIYGQGAQSMANIAGQEGQQLSGLRSNFGQLSGQAIGNTGQQGANMQFQGGQLGGQAISGAGQRGSNMQFQTGQLGGQAIGNTANNLSGLRWGAGQQVSQQMSGLGQGMAQNQLNLGSQLGGLTQSATNNLANLQQDQGQQGFNSRMQLAQILSNIASGQGTNLAALQSRIGQAQAGGATGGAAGMQQGVGNVIGLISQFMSDERLKENIQPIMRDNGIGFYAYTWAHNEAIPEELRGKQSFGTMAHEVQDKYPDCVVEHNGYLAVDYGKLAEKVRYDH